MSNYLHNLTSITERLTGVNNFLSMIVEYQSWYSNSALHLVLDKCYEMLLKAECPVIYKEHVPHYQ